MALMLRMAGHPGAGGGRLLARLLQPRQREYRVRDLDAHSWVEVYFTGIGWVPFDPTPTPRPAESQSSGDRATSAAAATPARCAPARDGAAASGAGGADAGGRRRTAAPAGSLAWCSLLLALAVAGGVALVQPACAGVRALGPARARPRRSSPSCAARSRGSAGTLPAATTLLGLERRLGRFAGPGVRALRRGAARAPLRPAQRPGAGAAPSAARCAAS